MAKNYNYAVLLDFYGDLLTEKRKDFVNYYYNEDLSLAEIAENEGLTRQGVRDTIQRAQQQLSEYEESLHMARTFRTLSQKAETLLRLADEMEHGAQDEQKAILEKIRAIARELQNLG